MFTLSQQANAREFLDTLRHFLPRHAALNFADAQIKYSYILNEVIKLDLPKSARILDLGCGDGHLSQALANMGYFNVVAVDSARRRLILDRPERPRQLAVNFILSFKNPKRLLSRSKYKFIRCDALNYLSSTDESSFEVVIDGCSITHFDTNPAGVEWGNDLNLGFCKSLFEIHRVLSLGGVLISSMDVCVSSDDSSLTPQYEFFSEQSAAKVVSHIFSSVVYDSHPKSWSESSENFRFVVNAWNRRIILGVIGFSAVK